MYRYETHLHTLPVSRCAQAGVEESLRFYKDLGYDGVFITNHFLDGNINISPDVPYKEKLDFYFSDYDLALQLGQALGLKVFLGVELSYLGTDFLIYGLEKEWYYAHPEIMDMPKSRELAFMMEAGALVVHAHPFRDARYIDHVRLFPKCVHAVEVVNANRTEFENRMAMEYAQNYKLLEFAGSDNHLGPRVQAVAGIETHVPLETEQDLKALVLAGKTSVFHLHRQEWEEAQNKK